MKKGSRYLIQAIISVVVLIQVLPAVERLESNWTNAEKSTASGLAMVMWMLFLILSLSFVVYFLQNIFWFIAEIKREKNVGDENATKAMELALKRIQLIMYALYQAMFGIGFVGFGCVVIFAPRVKVLGGDSPVPAGIVCVVVGGVCIGFAIWKTIKKWKAMQMQNKGMNQ